MSTTSTESDVEEENNVLVIELQSQPPYVCESLKLTKVKGNMVSNNKSYSFNITKAN